MTNAWYSGLQKVVHSVKIPEEFDYRLQNVSIISGADTSWALYIHRKGTIAPVTEVPAGEFIEISHGSIVVLTYPNADFSPSCDLWIEGGDIFSVHTAVNVDVALYFEVRKHVVLK